MRYRWLATLALGLALTAQAREGRKRKAKRQGAQSHQRASGRRTGIKLAPHSRMGVYTHANDPLAPQKAMTLRSIRAGTPQSSMGQLRDTLQTHPDDVDLHALMGIALAQIGQYPEARVELRFGLGSDFYEDDGLSAQADVLRAFGDGQAAARLRMGHYLSNDPNVARHASLSKMVDDLRRVGEIDQAYDIAWMAIARSPRSSIAHAALAQVLMDLGDLDGAAFHLWLPELWDTETLATLLASARLALFHDDPELARRFLLRAQMRQHKSRDMMLLLAEVERRTGDPQRALKLMERPRWGHHEIPAIMAEEVMVRWDVGQHTQARELLERALDLYPTDPDLALAVDHIGGS